MPTITILSFMPYIAAIVALLLILVIIGPIIAKK